jgi:hypothetical protein
MLVALDAGFFVLHTLLIAFNMVGWAWRRTRLLHLIALGLTSFSWFVLGAFYGWGYCLCTDWHFQVRRQLGYNDSEFSYVQLLASHVFGITLSQALADWLAGVVFGLILVATALVWAHDWYGRRRLVSTA